jgi:hypothetical protein
MFSDVVTDQPRQGVSGVPDQVVPRPVVAQSCSRVGMIRGVLDVKLT